MARLSRTLAPYGAVVLFAGKKKQNFFFDALGRTLRGGTFIGKTSLPGMLLAFDFAKGHVRVIEPLLYADGTPGVKDRRLLEPFVQEEWTYDSLASAVFADLLRRVKDCVDEGNARLVNGALPDAA